ncbi:unnamed protein product [Gongylonema pulchrum]|uniref:CN hydrolase domain-containing protein n=1 Tax=Gongylonema pulchrum TaxID=637853 RepID=A0A183EKY3_9BILA|nr:unnamed protein product [Gongylonema pulchrum]
MSFLLLHVRMSICQLNDYNEKMVFSFIETAAKRNVSQIGPYLSNYDTIPEQKEFFAAAYTSGDAEQFVSRDQDRWVPNNFFLWKI